MTFQPSTTAAETATLTITYVAALTNVPVTQTIALSGTGVAGSSTGPLPSGPLHFVAVAPCRLANTRLANAPFGGPHLAGGIKWDFSLSSGACGIPANAEAYALNVTVVPESRGLRMCGLGPLGKRNPKPWS